MKIVKLISFPVLIMLVILIACNKEAVHQNKSVKASQISGLVSSVCDQFTYADTIFYIKPQTSTYIIKPLKVLAGKYGSFPSDLVIDSTNGNIDVNKSGSGLKYIVWFIPNGSKDTCKKFVTISGVNYNNIVYVMTKNSTASPVYNADTTLPVVCNGCEFDDGPDDNNGNGNGDEPPAGQELVPQGFVINKSTGVIDFKKSFQNGALGKKPVSGTKKEFTLYYRLGDKSNKALNHISFELFYYTKQSDIPRNVMEDLLAKQSEVLLKTPGGNDDGGGGGHGGGGHGSNNVVSNSSAITMSKGSGGNGNKGVTKCRPPYIILTQQ